MTPNSDDPQVGIAGGDVANAARRLTLWRKCGMPDQSDDTPRREALKRDLDTVLSALSAQGGGSEPVAWSPSPLADDPAVAALCDSNYRAGALAGWNAAHHGDQAEGERIMQRIRAVEPGSLAPIVERNRLRRSLTAAPQSEALPVDGVEGLTADVVRRAWCAAFEIRGKETWLTLSKEARDAWTRMAEILAALPSNTGRRP